MGFDQIREAVKQTSNIRLLQKASGEMLALFSDAGIDCYMLVYQHRI